MIYLVFGDGALLAHTTDKDEAIRLAELFVNDGRAPGCSVIEVHGKIVHEVDG